MCLSVHLTVFVCLSCPRCLYQTPPGISRSQVLVCLHVFWLCLLVSLVYLWLPLSFWSIVLPIYDFFCWRRRAQTPQGTLLSGEKIHVPIWLSVCMFVCLCLKEPCSQVRKFMSLSDSRSVCLSVFSLPVRPTCPLSMSSCPNTSSNLSLSDELLCV